MGLGSSDSRPARRAFRWAHLFVQVCPGSECPTKTTSQTMPCWDGLDQPPPSVGPRSGQPPPKPLIFRCRADQPQTMRPPFRCKEPWNISRCVYARSCMNRPVYAETCIEPPDYAAPPPDPLTPPFPRAIVPPGRPRLPDKPPGPAPGTRSGRRARAASLPHCRAPGRAAAAGQGQGSGGLTGCA